eukprot:CAMPEP_0182926546 /NCGR_PEP_ID=MMETSP0105_2-20130417/12139_1 /TAXON_ID=81532 ORGANISM="Acanthoeca-like sp., Strain 10tr" /NCGR_SAMPLE_ID=MMETSP0105_2 /ASSEMBLY_ACC=CAM_ASM_000205 /LENGTH=166 /DNA_ID=CAMNT_0025064443 /DNA_START=13 /DNA_END=513 /DNA_ORIENTATION=-
MAAPFATTLDKGKKLPQEVTFSKVGASPFAPKDTGVPWKTSTAKSTGASETTKSYALTGGHRSRARVDYATQQKLRIEADARNTHELAALDDAAKELQVAKWGQKAAVPLGHSAMAYQMACEMVEQQTVKDVEVRRRREALRQMLADEAVETQAGLLDQGLALLQT